MSSLCGLSALYLVWSCQVFLFCNLRICGLPGLSFVSLVRSGLAWCDLALVWPCLIWTGLVQSSWPWAQPLVPKAPASRPLPLFECFWAHCSTPFDFGTSHVFGDLVRPNPSTAPPLPLRSDLLNLPCPSGGLVWSFYWPFGVIVSGHPILCSGLR